MIFTNDTFDIKKPKKDIIMQKKLIILQNKKSSGNLLSSNKVIDISTENEHPKSIEYIFEIKKIANEIAIKNKNKEIEIEFIGKTVFAFVFAQMFSYDSHEIITRDPNDTFKKIKINDIGISIDKKSK